MASFDIPKPVVSGLTHLAVLPDASIQELHTALESIPLRIKQHFIFDDSVFEVNSIPAEQAEGIKDAILPLYSGVSVGRVPLETYVDDIIESLREADQPGLEWLDNEETLDRFKARLTQLLSIGSLQLVAKAHDVLLQHAQTFSRARVVSDIRPVFGVGESIEGQPDAAVIVHMLKVTYHKAGRRADFVVALDTKDITDLIEVLERAKVKTERLKEVITSTNMTYLDVV